MDWKSIVQTVAPAIGTALGGPLGGVAARTIANTLLGKEEATPDEIAEAVLAANPDQLLALKKADQEFAIRMQEIGVELERVAAGDRDSARNREIQLRDRAPRVLATAIVTGFFLVLGAMIFVSIPETAQTAVNLLLGALTAMLTQVGNYYFGSSAGSARKTELMTQAPPKPPAMG